MLVFISSPYRGNVESNAAAAEEICRACTLAGVIPYAPHLFFTRFLNDAVPDERTAGIACGLKMMKLCDEVWFFGDPLTAGMRMESDCAKTQNKNTRYFGADWRDELTRVLREYQNTQGAKGKIKAK